MHLYSRKKLTTAVKDGGFDPKFNSKLQKLQTEYLKESLPMDSWNKRLENLKVCSLLYLLHNYNLDTNKILEQTGGGDCKVIDSSYLFFPQSTLFVNI
jgi:hypothetical protein